MWFRLIWIFGVLLFIATVVKSAGSNMHNHRYMLSDYKPQHNPKTQRDYKRLRMRSPEKAGAAHLPAKEEESKKEKNAHRPRVHLNKEISARSKEPVVSLMKTDTKLQLHELMVRLYHEHKFLCMGTLVSSVLVVTVATCFHDDQSPNLTVKTSSDDVYEGIRGHPNETFIRSEDPMLEVILLSKPITRPNITDDTVKLCDSEIKDYVTVELPIWIRHRHSIHSQISQVWPLQECRFRMKDPHGEIAQDNMICVRNLQYTRTCQHAMGNPLIYDGMICGINAAGHNCPHHTGVDLYMTIYDVLSFSITGMDLIKNNNLEDAIM
ncbi:hypothetical protein KR018_004841 [Drosophila ironensis]|nr:hypothetical protein KR018_004841 [Drosophila ironensis]